MEFIKYHGLGNDYLVLHDYKHFTSNIDLPPKQVQRICDRNYGLGSDGILIGKKDISGGYFHLRIFNSDGTQAEKSGNGLRIFARYLWDLKLVNNSTFVRIGSSIFGDRN